MVTKATQREIDYLKLNCQILLGMDDIRDQVCLLIARLIKKGVDINSLPDPIVEVYQMIVES